MAAAARSAFRRSSTHFLFPIPNHQPISTAITLSPPIHLRPPSNPRLQISTFRCYARMARRSPPPARRNADEKVGSESESQSEEEVNEIDFDDFAGEDDDGEVSEELEGFMTDFGAIGKKDGGGSNKEEQP